MTPETLALGNILIGLCLGALGVGVMWLVSGEWWAERQARKAERIVTESPDARRQRLMVAVSTPKNAASMDVLLAELLATPRVPEQRDGRGH